LVLVLFTDQGAPLSREEAAAQNETERPGAAEQLERELRDTRERLQSLIEEYETALEELKSSNEELVSVNEELQSTNEELEASKEELQSLNEELHTVNQELSGKVDELDHANADLQNLFESSRVGTIFLDQSLVIRSFTPSVSEVLNILPSDIGRPITDLTSRLVMPSLAEDIRAVLKDGGSSERRVSSAAGDLHFLVRLAPYLDGDKKKQGVVATFADITVVAKAEAHQRVLIDELNHRVKNMLMVAISMLEQTSKNTDPAQFREVFSARLHSMARSYELLSQENWTEVSVGELVRQELEPFGMHRVECDGGDVHLKPRRALSLGMILHELVTNAAKYGALSNSHGKVVVAWKADDDGMQLDWVERDGPQVASPTRRGLGMKLVEREAVAGLGGKSKIDFEPNGLRVSLEIDLA
jgi:two-component system, chemotaxis family, CheB/CheR fusion protein